MPISTGWCARGYECVTTTTSAAVCVSCEEDVFLAECPSWDGPALVAAAAYCGLTCSPVEGVTYGYDATTGELYARRSRAFLARALRATVVARGRVRFGCPAKSPHGSDARGRIFTVRTPDEDFSRATRHPSLDNPSSIL